MLGPMSYASLLDLPNELVVAVLNCCTIEDQITLGSVCKYLKALCLGVLLETWNLPVDNPKSLTVSSSSTSTGEFSMSLALRVLRLWYPQLHKNFDAVVFDINGAAAYRDLNQATRFLQWAETVFTLEVKVSLDNSSGDSGMLANGVPILLAYLDHCEVKRLNLEIIDSTPGAWSFNDSIMLTASPMVHLVDVTLHFRRRGPGGPRTVQLSAWFVTWWRHTLVHSPVKRLCVLGHAGYIGHLFGKLAFASLEELHLPCATLTGTFLASVIDRHPRLRRLYFSDRPIDLSVFPCFEKRYALAHVTTIAAHPILLWEILHSKKGPLPQLVSAEIQFRDSIDISTSRKEFYDSLSCIRKQPSLRRLTVSFLDRSVPELLAYVEAHPDLWHEIFCRPWNLRGDASPQSREPICLLNVTEFTYVAKSITDSGIMALARQLDDVFPNLEIYTVKFEDRLIEDIQPDFVDALRLLYTHRSITVTVG